MNNVLYNPCAECEYKTVMFKDCYDKCTHAIAIESLKSTVEDQRETIESLKKDIKKYRLAKDVIVAVTKQIK